jgi:hypothetical protein
MRNRALMTTILALAVMFWVGLILLANQRPPNAANQTLFLLLWGLAVAASLTPLAYALGGRLARRFDDEEALLRALRQGLEAGILAMVLMALRFMRLLNLLSAVLLALLIIAIEVLILLRRR